MQQVKQQIIEAGKKISFVQEWISSAKEVIRHSFLIVCSAASLVVP